jgi:hypothetical protein
MAVVVLLKAESTQGQSVTGRIRSTKKSSDLVGNRTRDLPACDIVSQQTIHSRRLRLEIAR